MIDTATVEETVEINSVFSLLIIDYKCICGFLFGVLTVHHKCNGRPATQKRVFFVILILCANIMPVSIIIFIRKEHNKH